MPEQQLWPIATLPFGRATASDLGLIANWRLRVNCVNMSARRVRPLYLREQTLSLLIARMDSKSGPQLRGESADMPKERPTVAPFGENGVRGFLHRPATSCGEGMVLTHGAGGNCNAPLLVAASNAFSDSGLHVLRCDLPFRQRRPTGPPSPATAAKDREGLRCAVAAMRRFAPGKVFLGGESYGGRQATILAAEEPSLVDALLLFSYPLHPPGKPTQLRTEHFPRIRVPVVFVHGTADPFGSIRELEEAISAISAPVKLLRIEGAGHDLKRGLFDLGGVVDALAAISMNHQD
jgi:predicted alpha/beta-hydrolase family hydrolase